MGNIFIRQKAFSKRKYNSKQIEDEIAKNTLKEAVRTLTLQQRILDNRLCIHLVSQLVIG